jgi:hypothetical protein
MEKELHDLTSILSNEEQVFHDYLELLSLQQEYLIKNNLAGIKATIEQINMLAQDAINLENKRRKVIARLSELAHLRPDELNITKLLKKFKGPKFDELERLKDAIIKINERVQDQKNRNELLINQSMGMITQTMQFIHNAGNPKVTYDDPSSVRGGASGHAALISRMI